MAIEAAQVKFQRSPVNASTAPHLWRRNEAFPRSYRLTHYFIRIYIYIHTEYPLSCARTLARHYPFTESADISRRNRSRRMWKRRRSLTTTANASLRAIYDWVTVLDNLYNVTQYSARAFLYFYGTQ